MKAMPALPITIGVTPVSPAGPRNTVLCLGVLRELAHTRLVYDAVIEQRPIILKVFVNRCKAETHARREWRGLGRLKERGVRTPEPLFVGRTDAGDWAVATEKLTAAVPLSDAWRDADDERRRTLLLMFCRELACQHAKGVLQRDLHFGNFLLQEERLFALDPAQIRFRRGEVGRREAIAQLAMLASGLRDEPEQRIAELREQYAAARGWRLSAGDNELFLRLSATCREDRIDRARAKSLRTNVRDVRIERPGILAMATREFHAGGNVDEFVGTIDELIARGRNLKRGSRTCTLSRVNWGGLDIVIKRYNPKGILHRLKWGERKSRARRCWLYAHELWLRRIPTARHLAFIEKSSGSLVHTSYYVSEYVEGRALRDTLEDETLDQGERERVAGEVVALLNRLAENRITHGDLKHKNILVAEQGPTLVDLDAMTRHKSGRGFRSARSRDLARFLENFAQMPAFHELFRNGLR